MCESKEEMMEKVIEVLNIALLNFILTFFFYFLILPINFHIIHYTIQSLKTSHHNKRNDMKCQNHKKFGRSKKRNAKKMACNPVRWLIVPFFLLSLSLYTFYQQKKWHG